MKKTSSLYRAIWRAFEHPNVFRLNQVLLDGGKRTPVSAFLAEVPYRSVVDIGCGPGTWVHLARGPYLGLDDSESFIRFARSRFSGYPDVRFEQGDATRLDPEEPFDLGLLISVLHHLSDVQVGRLLAWTRVRTRRLFVLDLYPNPGNPLSRLLYAMDRGDHIRTPEEQERILLADSGYRVDKRSDFYSYNRLYRHSMFLLGPRGE